MTRLPLSLSLLIPLVGACELKAVSLTGDGPQATSTTGGSGDPSGDPSGATTTAEPTSDGTDSTTGAGEPVTAVDVLFVIDNSGSMAQHQGRLVASIPAFLAGLDGLDLRIAVTTTDAANPTCNVATTTPEGGKFVMRSCVEAVGLGEFELNQEDLASACTDHCMIAPEDFVVAPTATALDPDPKPRAWIERTGGALNLAADLDDILACAIPQGVAGCGFESPLRSMYNALAQATIPESHTNYGFLRPEADLRIVFVTDEADCSYVHEFKDIFAKNKIFWENQNDPMATSAVCFNAGVTCDGGPGTYTSCTSADFDIHGHITTDTSEAVLEPVSNYVQFLQGIQASKTGSASVKIFALAGVPIGFETGTVPLVYADNPDPGEQDKFGIGPGCTAPDPSDPQGQVVAFPPTRLLSVAEAFGPPQFFSICDDSFDAALMAAGFTP